MPNKKCVLCEKVANSSQFRSISSASYEWFHKYLREKNVIFEVDNLQLCSSCTGKFYALKEELDSSLPSSLQASPSTIVESMEIDDDTLCLANFIYAGSG